MQHDVAKTHWNEEFAPIHCPGILTSWRPRYDARSSSERPLTLSLIRTRGSTGLVARGLLNDILKGTQ